MSARFIIRSSYGNDSVALIQWAHEQGVEAVARAIYAAMGHAEWDEQYPSVKQAWLKKAEVVIAALPREAPAAVARRGVIGRDDDQAHLDAARAAYFAAGGRENDARRVQKVSRIQIAIQHGSDGVLASPAPAPEAPAGVTAAMVNAAWNEAKNRRMTGLPTDFRAVLEASLATQADAPKGYA